jgi:hypothetical protein
MSELIAMAMHLPSRRPACVNLQAVFGCTDRNLFMQIFDSQDWEVSDITNIRLVTGTKEQWRRHARHLEVLRSVKR